MGTGSVTTAGRAMAATFGLGLLGAGAAGLLFGLGETAWLRWGGFSLGLRDVGTILLAHTALGVVVGAPFGLGAALLRGLTWRRPDTRAWRFVRRLIAAGPALATLLVLGGLLVNIRWLPKRLDPMSLAVDGTLVAGALAIGLLWAARPWGRRGDRRLLVAAALGVVAVTAGLFVQRSADGGFGDEAPRASAPLGAPNLVIVLLDTLRADHLGAYGYARPTSPRIDELASRGHLFERAYSSSNWTRPALASLHTSTHPLRHQVVDLDRGVPRSLPLLAEHLQRHGYATGMVSVGANFEPADGYARGVDYFYITRPSAAVTRTTLFQNFVLRDFPATRPWLIDPAPTAEWTRPENITEQALTFVRSVKAEQPLFLFLHYMGPHDPYDPPPPYDGIFGDRGSDPGLTRPPDDLWAGPDWLSPADRQQMIDQYDEEIVWHDEYVGKLLDSLRGLGRLDDAVVVITSDHGEGFGEHGMWAHNVALFEEVVHIPLILWTTQATASPRRHPHPASLLDIAPTLVEMAGLPPVPSFDGQSLVPRLYGGGNGRERVVFQQNPLNGESGLRSPDWAYFQEERFGQRREWLYRAEDVRQEANLAREDGDVVASLDEQLRHQQAFDRERRHEAEHVTIDAAREEQLRALGYVE